MAVHSFVDESIRASDYYLISIRIESGDIGWLRSHVAKKFRYRARPLHMHRESESVRKCALNELCRLPLSIDIFQARITKSVLDARHRTLTKLSDPSLLGDCKLIVLENISSDLQDKQILRKMAKEFNGNFPEFRHMSSHQEPLLRLADVAAWSFGRGGRWRLDLSEKIGQIFVC